MTHKKTISLKPALAPLAGIADRSIPGHDERLIRELRARSNTAIAAHDARVVGAAWMPTIHVSVGDGQPLIGREAVQAAFDRAFDDPTFITYQRNPQVIAISDDGFAASEAGDWLGQWTKPDGLMEWRGNYLAVWRKLGGRWQLQSELFASLKCSGSRDCLPR